MKVEANKSNESKRSCVMNGNDNSLPSLPSNFSWDSRFLRKKNSYEKD